MYTACAIEMFLRLIVMIGVHFSELKVDINPIVLNFTLTVCVSLPIRLKYDASTNSYYNNSQVKIHVPGFGKTSGVEYLDPGWIDLIPYFHDMVEYFVDRGYVRGKSIRAAPYDWRLAAGMYACTHTVHVHIIMSGNRLDQSLIESSQVINFVFHLGINQCSLCYSISL